jgi:hypothetical protein
MKYLFVIFSLFLVMPAYAEDTAGAYNSKKCSVFMLSISYSATGKSFVEVEKKFSEYAKQLENYADEQKLSKPKKAYSIGQSRAYKESFFSSNRDDSGDLQYYGKFQITYELDNIKDAAKHGDSFASIENKGIEIKNREITLQSCVN